MHPEPVPTSAKLNSALMRKKFEDRFDDQFGFRPGNQDVRRDFEIEFEKLLMAGDVLQRLAARRDARRMPRKSCDCSAESALIVVRNQKGAVTSEGVAEQERSFESGFIYALRVVVSPPLP